MNDDKKPETEDLTDEDLDQTEGGFSGITLKKGYVVTADLQKFTQTQVDLKPANPTISDFQDGDDLFVRKRPGRKSFGM